MRINGIRCDGCGEERLFKPTLVIGGTNQQYVPPDWFIVSIGYLVGDNEPWLFCSKECLRRHPLSATKED